MALTVDEIVTATGANVTNVAEAWPLVTDALDALGIRTHNVELAAAATIAVETGTFKSVIERGDEKYFERYDGRMGNLPGEGYRFRGRGFIQLTGRRNYERFGKLLEVDLVQDPDLALLPVHAAKILALYFKERAVHKYADAGDWKKTRTLVNGGLNGWARYERILKALGVIFPLDTTDNATTIVSGGLA